MTALQVRGPRGGNGLSIKRADTQPPVCVFPLKANHLSLQHRPPDVSRKSNAHITNSGNV